MGKVAFDNKQTERQASKPNTRRRPPNPTTGQENPSPQASPPGAPNQLQSDIAQGFALLMQARAGRGNAAPSQQPAEPTTRQSTSTPTSRQSDSSSSSKENSHRTDFYVQEAEIYFTAPISPYLSGYLSLGMGWHPAMPEMTQRGIPGHFDWHLEEAFVETDRDTSWSLKAGQFYARFGNHNSLHRHDWLFTTAPLIHQTLFDPFRQTGGHNLSGPGLSLSFAPSLPWDFETTAQAFYSPRKIPVLKNFSAGLLFIKNAYELNRRFSGEWNFSIGTGLSPMPQHSINFVSSSPRPIYERLYSSALNLKYYGGLGSHDPALSWTLEFLQGVVKEGNGVRGFSSWLKWRFSKDLFLQGRGEILSNLDDSLMENQRYTTLFGWSRSARSQLRLEYSLHKKQEEKWKHEVALQAVMSWGASDDPHSSLQH